MNEYDNNGMQPPKGGRLIFGILMVLVYLCVGLLFILDIFHIGNAVTYVIGGLLIVYGIWRGIRLYKGWG
ncbi:MAG: hypothetical protein NC204_06705 [Candidatus Amulumruptor caecigallinarius]|nr:hypothetical protein [Candidatus Amulumruptor caecigallinarius]